jgi:hypothetical protein
MNKISIFLVFSATVYSMQLAQEVCELQIKASFSPSVQMEMGMARAGHEPRSDIEACADCMLNPDHYISIAAQTVPLIYLVDMVWDSCQQTNPTAFLPMVYASAMALNSASIVRTVWQGFRESKYKTKQG